MRDGAAEAPGSRPAEREDLGRLFRPFSRLHDRKASGIQGFGLGLSISERFVRAHGGRCEVTSVPGEGSTFSFTLPLFGALAQARSPVVVVATTALVAASSKLTVTPLRPPSPASWNPAPRPPSSRSLPVPAAMDSAAAPGAKSAVAPRWTT